MKAKYKKLIFKILKVFIPLAAVAIILFFVTLRVKAFFQETGYFNVKTIVIVGNGKLDLTKDADLKNLVGVNIFDVDLEATASRIMQKYPGILKTEVLRDLPNRLVVRINMRQAVAQLKLNKYFLIDTDMVVLPGPLDGPQEDLIVIRGLENRVSAVIGRQLRLKEIAIALNFIDALRNVKDLKDYQITEINVLRLADTSISLSPKFNSVQDTKSQNLIQVKIGNEDFKDRLKVLSHLLASVRPYLDKVKYIDLRFKEPVVGKD